MNDDTPDLLRTKFPNQPWLVSSTIFMTLHGSWAYGTNTAKSDIDIKGVAIPPAQYFHGFTNRFDQAESKDPDMVVYDIRKFFKLAAECNPNIIEVLWTDEADHRIVTPLGRRLIDSRELFISKKARHTFSGYARSQLRRINSHYRWLHHPPTAPPTRKEFELPERTVIPADQLEAAQAAIAKKLVSWELDDMSGIEPADRIRLQSSMAELLAEMKLSSDESYAAAARSIGYSENFIRLLDLERRYKARKADWESYQTWLENRNPERAELEAKFGFDTKHGAHLVRLMRMCREILETGRVLVKRPDREELLAIRGGAWSYERLVEWSLKQDLEMDEVYKTSTLRHHPDHAKLDELCQLLVEARL